MNIATAFNKVLRKRFLVPNTIGLIPLVGYTINVKYSNKAIIRLMYSEQTDGCTIWLAINAHEYRTPQIPNLSVDGFCAETRTVYEYFEWLFHGHTGLPYRDVTSLGGDKLAER